MKSIIQQGEPRCFVCLARSNLHEHHVIYGTADRKQSEKYGLKVYLCAKHHNKSKAGVHSNHKLDIKLKQLAQRKFEQHYPDKEWLTIFSKNYLE